MGYVGDGTARRARALVVGVTALALLLGNGVASARAADGASAEPALPPAATTTTTTTTTAAPVDTSTPADTDTLADTPEPTPAETQPAAAPAPPQPVPTPQVTVLEVAPPPVPVAPAAPAPASVAPPAPPIAAGGGPAEIHSSSAVALELPGPALPADLGRLPDDAGTSPPSARARPAHPLPHRPVVLPPVGAVRGSTPTATRGNASPRPRRTAAAKHPAGSRAAEPAAAELPGRLPPLPPAHSAGGGGTTPAGSVGGLSCPGSRWTSRPAAALLVALEHTSGTLHADAVLRLRIERPG